MGDQMNGGKTGGIQRYPCRLGRRGERELPFAGGETMTGMIHGQKRAIEQIENGEPGRIGTGPPAVHEQ